MRLLPFLATALILSLVPMPVLSQASQRLEGRLVQEGTNATIAGATVTIVGLPGTALSDAQGRFTWAPAPLPPFQLIVILPGGQVAGPILVERLAGGIVPIAVAAVREEAVTVIGAAPSVDTTPGAAQTLLSGHENAAILPGRIEDRSDRAGVVLLVPDVRVDHHAAAGQPFRQLDRAPLLRHAGAERADHAGAQRSARFGPARPNRDDAPNCIGAVRHRARSARDVDAFDHGRIQERRTGSGAPLGRDPAAVDQEERAAARETPNRRDSRVRAPDDRRFVLAPGRSANVTAAVEF